MGQVLFVHTEPDLIQAARAGEGFQSSLVASSAPASLSAADTRLQQDLAQADSALIAMSAALSRGDQAGFNAGRVTLRFAFSAVDRDVSVI